MLSDQKQGWQGRSGGFISPGLKLGKGRLKRSSRRTSRAESSTIDGSVKKSPSRAPKDRIQFQRDWRQRCHTDDGRRSYLNLVGHDMLPVLFCVEMEPDLLGQILSVVCSKFLSHPQSQQVDTLALSAPIESKAESYQQDLVEDAGVCPTEKNSILQAARHCLHWLWALARTGHFELNTQFLEDKEKCMLTRVFDLIKAILGARRSGDLGKVSSLQKAYMM